jgi:hypothetical protein
MTQSGSEHGNISGVWHGSYKSDRLPGPVNVVIMFQQLTTQEFEESPYWKGSEAVSGETVVGAYKAEDGAIGTISGSIEGENVTLTATQTTPTCPGSFELQGILTGDHFEWNFQGEDCLGRHSGNGSADRP